MKVSSQIQTAYNVPDFVDVLLTNSRSLIFIKDSQSRLLYGNPAFMNLFAPDQRDAMIGGSLTQDFADEESKVFLAEDRIAFETGFSEIIEEITDYTGTKLILQTQKIRYHDQRNKPFLLGIATDISPIAERGNLLARSNVALENFAAAAAHDLRSPLGAIESCIDMIEGDKYSFLGAQSLKYLGLMRQSTNGLMQQITTLLTSYKANHHHTEREVCDCSLILEEVKFNLSAVVQETNARVLSNNLPRLLVNHTLFRQLLHNLIENSLKYRSTQTPIIILRHEHRNNEDFFAIEDNGIGISPECGDLFAMYRQADDEAEGYGIGLALCQKIVTMHGGKIWFDKTYQTGCRVCFTIRN